MAAWMMAALAALQAQAPAEAATGEVPLAGCLGAQVYVGYGAPFLDALATETLDRFIAGNPLHDPGARIAILVASPIFRGMEQNEQVVRGREAAIRDHLVRGGLPAERVRILDGGDHGRPNYNPQAAIIVVERPVDAALGCARLERQPRR